MQRQEAVINKQVAGGIEIGLQGVLNTLNIGVMVLTKSGEVLLANSAAESIVDSRHWLRVVDRRLRCRPEQSSELDHRISMASQARIDDSESILHLSGANRQDSLLLAFTSLSHSGSVCQDAEGAKFVVCIVADPERNPPTDADLLKRLYPLTDAEANIAAFLANGLDYTEIAHQRNVTVATIRSYSKSIFRKLCVNSRAGVVRKVLAATIPLSLRA